MEIIVTKENFNEVVNKYDLVIIDFFATWCMPCKMLSSELETLQEKYPNIVVGRIDCDQQMELAQKFKIYSIPDLFIFKKGNQVSNIVGYLSADELEAKLKEWI